MIRAQYQRPSLAGPLILISIGVVFLLNNLGILSGSFWEALIRFWPLILVIFGLDAIYRGESLFGSIFTVGLGIVFLLMNLGYLNGSVWDVIFRFWPVWIIMLGVDIILSRTRHNLWVSVAGIFIALALVFGIVWFANTTYTGPKVTKSEVVDLPLGSGVEEANINISAATGELNIHPATQAASLMSGTVTLEKMESVQKNQVHQGTTDLITLHSKGIAITPTFGGENRNVWDLGLTPGVDINLDANLAAGMCNLDLRGLRLRDLGLSMGIGKCTIYLSEQGGYSTNLSGAIGDITVIVPQNVPVRIHLGNALTVLSLDPEFQRDGSLVTYSPQGGQVAPLDVEAGMAIGHMSIRLSE